VQPKRAHERGEKFKVSPKTPRRKSKFTLRPTSRKLYAELQPGGSLPPQRKGTTWVEKKKKKWKGNVECQPGGQRKTGEKRWPLQFAAERLEGNVSEKKKVNEEGSEWKVGRRRKNSPGRLHNKKRPHARGEPRTEKEWREARHQVRDWSPKQPVGHKTLAMVMDGKRERWDRGKGSTPWRARSMT